MRCFSYIHKMNRIGVGSEIPPTIILVIRSEGRSFRLICIQKKDGEVYCRDYDYDSSFIHIPLDDTTHEGICSRVDEKILELVDLHNSPFLRKIFCGALFFLANENVYTTVYIDTIARRVWNGYAKYQIKNTEIEETRIEDEEWVNIDESVQDYREYIRNLIR